MKKFDGLAELLLNFNSLDWDSAVFCDFQKWQSSPLRCELIVLEGDEELEELGDEENHIPRIALDVGMRQLLDTETLRDVLEHLRGRSPHPSAEDFANAINHYREYDDFFHPE